MNTCQNITAFANAASGSSVVSCALSIINSIIPIIMAITVLWVIWGSFNLIKSDDADRKKYGQVILWGIVGLFIMVSVWGLVNILTGTFGFGGQSVTAPDLSKVVQNIKVGP